MISVIWEFRVGAGKCQSFESVYNGNGIWAQLFRRAPGYGEALLLKGPAKASRYLTTDLWEDKESYETFQERFADDYKKIDAECEKLAQAEQRIGLFERLA